jgi:hypothetical protein
METLDKERERGRDSMSKEKGELQRAREKCQVTDVRCRMHFDKDCGRSTF